MMRLAAALGIALALLGASSTAGAQQRRGSAVGPIERRAGPAAERREQIKKKIRALRAFTLIQELGIDEATATRLFPVLARYDDETDKLLERRIEVQRRLRRVDSLRDPRAIDRLIDDAVGIQRGFGDIDDRKIAELRKILTPTQTARLLVVLPALDRKIQNQLRKAIVQRRGGGATVDDGDDDVVDDEAPPAPPARRREGPLAPRLRGSNAPGNTPPCDPRSEPCH